MARSRHSGITIAITVAGLVLVVCAAWLLLGRRTNPMSDAYCEKPQNQIGSCAQLVVSQSLLGTNKRAVVYVAPTNTEEPPVQDLSSYSGRIIAVDVDTKCANDYKAASWNEQGFVIETESGSVCTIDRETIGQW